MNKPISPQRTRERALFLYFNALERGDFTKLGQILKQAERDPILERMIADLDAQLDISVEPPEAELRTVFTSNGIEEVITFRRSLSDGQTPDSNHSQEDKTMYTTTEDFEQFSEPIVVANKMRWIKLIAAILILALIGLLTVIMFRSGYVNIWMLTQGQLTPTPTPSPTPTPKIITPENADQIKQLGLLGRGTITDMAWSPDGKTLALASKPSGIIWLYDPDDLSAEPRWLPSHKGGTLKLAFNADGTTLASSGLDNHVRLWNLASGEVQADFDTHQANMLAVTTNGKLLAGSINNTIRVWDTVTGGEIAVLQSDQRVSAIDLNPNGSLLVSGSVDSVQVWDVASSTLLATLEGHKNGVNTVAFNPAGDMFASGDKDGVVRLWDWNGTRGTLNVELRGHDKSVEKLAFSRDGKTLASADEAGTIRLWDTETGSNRAVLTGHTDQIGNITFNPNSTILASVSADETLRLWDVTTGAEVREASIKRGHGYTLGLAFSPDGKTLASGGQNANVYLWDVATRTQQTVLQGHKSEVWGVAFSPDGKSLASSDSLGTIHLWDVATGESRAALKGHSGYVFRVRFSPDGTLLVSSGTDGTIRIWDAATGANRAVLKANQGAVGDVVFSPDGKILASGGQNGTLHLWDATGADLGALQGSGEFFTLAFSPDGKTLAAGSIDTKIWLWDMATKEVRATLEGHESYVMSVAFSPDGRLLVTGSGSNFPQQAARDTTVRLWDVASGAQLAVLQGHNQGVEIVTFSPDGTMIATGSDDGTIRLWGISDSP